MGLPGHAVSRYGNVADDVIGACQRDHQAERKPNYSASHLELSTARIIVAESQEADAPAQPAALQLVAQFCGLSNNMGSRDAFQVCRSLYNFPEPGHQHTD